MSAPYAEGQKRRPVRNSQFSATRRTTYTAKPSARRRAKLHSCEGSSRSRHSKAPSKLSPNTRNCLSRRKRRRGRGAVSSSSGLIADMLPDGASCAVWPSTSPALPADSRRRRAEKRCFVRTDAPPRWRYTGRGATVHRLAVVLAGRSRDTELMRAVDVTHAETARLTSEAHQPDPPTRRGWTEPRRSQVMRGA